jgi:hypothetical protein
MCGILLQHKNDGNRKQKIYKKASHDGSYGMEAVTPIYPDQQLPNLFDLYGAVQERCDQFAVLKVTLLAWMVGVEPSVVAKIPPEYLISLLTIVYLHKVSLKYFWQLASFNLCFLPFPEKAIDNPSSGPDSHHRTRIHQWKDS